MNDKTMLDTLIHAVTELNSKDVWKENSDIGIEEVLKSVVIAPAKEVSNTKILKVEKVFKFILIFKYHMNAYEIYYYS